MQNLTPTNTTCSSHDALEAVLEPLDRLCLVDAVRGADSALASPALGNAFTGPSPVSVSQPVLPFNKCTSLLTCNSKSPFHRYQWPGRI